jgi:hypothetical protein
MVPRQHDGPLRQQEAVAKQEPPAVPTGVPAMKVTAAAARMHAASLKYQLISRAMENWGTTTRYCVIVLATTAAPALVAWLLSRRWS